MKHILNQDYIWFHSNLKNLENYPITSNNLEFLIIIFYQVYSQHKNQLLFKIHQMML